MLPLEVAARYGIAPGARIRVDKAADGLKLLRPSRLMKLYIESTNQCNMDCRTCMRNIWEEPLGMMFDAVFDRIIEGLKAFSPPPTVFFGGFGEHQTKDDPKGLTPLLCSEPAYCPASSRY